MLILFDFYEDTNKFLNRMSSVVSPYDPFDPLHPLPEQKTRLMAHINGELRSLFYVCSKYINMDGSLVESVEINPENRIVVTLKDKSFLLLNTENVTNIENFEELCGFKNKELQVAILKNEIEK